MAVEITVPGGEVEVVSRPWEAVVSSSSGAATVRSAAGAAEAVSEGSVAEARTGVVVGGIPYEGEYEARALFSAQTFPTAQKTMKRDFSVRAINYTEAPNEYGKTLTIGG